MFKRKADGTYAFSTRFWTAMVVLAVIVVAIGWRTQRTANQSEEAIEISRQVALEAKKQADLNKDCFAELATVLAANRKITQENDDNSQRQRELFLRRDEAEAEWLRVLIAPPPDIAKLDINDPKRQEYGLNVTQDYFRLASDYTKQITDLKAEQDALERKRLENPIPESTCVLLPSK